MRGIANRSRTGPSRCRSLAAPSSSHREISENSTSEADFEAKIGITKALAPITVTANSGVLSGLDNDLAHPDDAGKPHEEEVRDPSIDNGRGSAVFRSRRGRAQPEAMIETIFGEQRDGAGFNF